MAGGIWTAQNKVRPGVYIRFRSAAAAGVQAGERGVVAIARLLSWGPSAQISEFTPTSDAVALTGYDVNDTENMFLAEMFKGSNRTAAPSKVLLYRLAGAGQAVASAVIGNLTATAVYPGVRGNDIVVTISENVGASDFTVTTSVDGEAVDIQTAASVGDLVANAWVEWSGEDEAALAASVGIALTGGADGTIQASAYTSFLTALEPYKFDILCYDGSDSTVSAAFIAFIKRIASENGQYAQVVLSGSEGADSRFVINVASGVTLDDGTELTAAQTCWWVSGVEAGARYNESLTYASYPGASAATAMTNSQVIAAIEAGSLVLNSDDGSVKIETDINSLITYTEDIGKVFRKNRVMRLCNQIANDIYSTFSQSFIGVVNNDEIGRSRFKAVVVSYLTGIQANRGIQNFTGDDVEVLQGNDIDSVVVNLAIQPVDAIEKIYITVEVA